MKRTDKGVVLKKLREMIVRHGSQARVADVLGVSRSYLSEILKGTREPGEKVLAGLGIERRISYIEAA